MCPLCTSLLCRAVELRGFEPLTSAVQERRSPNGSFATIGPRPPAPAPPSRPPRMCAVTHGWTLRSAYRQVSVRMFWCFPTGGISREIEVPESPVDGAGPVALTIMQTLPGRAGRPSRPMREISFQRLPSGQETSVVNRLFSRRRTWRCPTCP